MELEGSLGLEDDVVGGRVLIWLGIGGCEAESDRKRASGRVFCPACVCVCVSTPGDLPARVQEVHLSHCSAPRDSATRATLPSPSPPRFPAPFSLRSTSSLSFVFHSQLQQVSLFTHSTTDLALNLCLACASSLLIARARLSLPILLASLTRMTVSKGL